MSSVKDITPDIFALCDKQSAAFWATACAEHVLYLFEEEHPEDVRPRVALEAVKAWMRNKISVGEARRAAFAAHEAAKKAYSPGAVYAAHACGHAAASVYIKTNAPHAANYAIRAVCAAGADLNEEKLWQYEKLLEITGDIE
jgi:hypothetical protein